MDFYKILLGIPTILMSTGMILSLLTTAQGDAKIVGGNYTGSRGWFGHPEIQAFPEVVALKRSTPNSNANSTRIASHSSNHTLLNIPPVSSLFDPVEGTGNFKPGPRSTRRKRSCKFDVPTSTCKLTPEEILDLESTIQTAHNEMTSGHPSAPQAKRPHSPQQPGTDTDPACLQMISNMKTLLTGIVKEIRLFKNAQLATTDELLGALETIQDQQQNFQELVDNIQRSHGQAVKEMQDKLDTTAQSLQAVINQKTAQIQTLLRNLEETNMKLLISSIHSGNIQAALTALAEISIIGQQQADTFFRTIVRGVYKPGDSGSISNMLDFFLHVRPQSFDLVSYPALFHEMSSFNDLSSPILIKFSRFLQKTTGFTSFKKLSQDDQQIIKNLDRKVNTHINALLYQMGTGIQKGNYAQTLTWLKDYPTELTGKLVEIIRAAYGCSLDRLDQMLAFIRTVPNWTTRLRLLRHLLDAMIQCGNMISEKGLQVVEEVDKTDKGIYGRVPSNLKTELDELITVIPTSMKFFLRTSHCAIENVKYNEFMYAVTDAYKYNRERRYVLTWTNGGQVAEGDWVFEPQSSAKSFKIKSKYCNESLHATAKDWDGSIFTGTGDDSVNLGHWRVIPEPNGSFKIFNIKAKQFLVASYRKYNQYRRYILTAANPDNGSQYWRFVCK